MRVTREGDSGPTVDVVRKPIDDAIGYAAQLGVVHGLVRNCESLEWIRPAGRDRTG